MLPSRYSWRVAGAKAVKEPKPLDLSALHEAIAAASRRGNNVDAIRTALEAFEKSQPKGKVERVPAELQALRDAVDAARRKGENVDGIAKELVAIEVAVVGKSLAKPRPEPRPEPMLPNFGVFPDPPFPILPNPGFGVGGIDIEMFNKAMALRRKALELRVEKPRDPEAAKEALKLEAEARELIAQAARNAGGLGFEMVRIPDRARLGIRIERVPPIAVEQLGLEANTGVAVSFVSPGSAAEKAGLKTHDIVLEFGGKPVTDNTDEFIRRVNDVKTGEKVDLIVLRKGKKVDVKGIELPDVPPRRPVTPQLPRAQPMKDSP
jgi:hypothetical protein